MAIFKKKKKRGDTQHMLPGRIKLQDSKEEQEPKQQQEVAASKTKQPPQLLQRYKVHTQSSFQRLEETPSSDETMVYEPPQGYCFEEANRSNYDLMTASQLATSSSSRQQPPPKSKLKFKIPKTFQRLLQDNDNNNQQYSSMKTVGDEKDWELVKHASQKEVLSKKTKSLQGFQRIDDSNGGDYDDEEHYYYKPPAATASKPRQDVFQQPNSLVDIPDETFDMTPFDEQEENDHDGDDDSHASSFRQFVFDKNFSTILAVEKSDSGASRTQLFRVAAATSVGRLEKQKETTLTTTKQQPKKMDDCFSPNPRASKSKVYQGAAKGPTHHQVKSDVKKKPALTSPSPQERNKMKSSAKKLKLTSPSPQKRLEMKPVKKLTTPASTSPKRPKSESVPSPLQARTHFGNNYNESITNKQNFSLLTTEALSFSQSKSKHHRLTKPTLSSDSSSMTSSNVSHTGATIMSATAVPDENFPRNDGGSIFEDDSDPFHIGESVVNNNNAFDSAWDINKAPVFHEQQHDHGSVHQEQNSVLSANESLILSIKKASSKERDNADANSWDINKALVFHEQHDHGSVHREQNSVLSANESLILSIKKASSKERDNADANSFKPDPSPCGSSSVVPQNFSDSVLESRSASKERFNKRSKKREAPESPGELKQSCSDSVLEEERAKAKAVKMMKNKKTAKAPTGVPANAILASMLFRQTQVVGAPSPDAASIHNEHEQQEDGDNGDDMQSPQVPPSIHTNAKAESTVSSVTEEASLFYSKNFQNFQAWKKQAHSVLEQYHMKRSKKNHPDSYQADTSGAEANKTMSTNGRTWKERVEQEHMQMFD